MAKRNGFFGWPILKPKGRYGTTDTGLGAADGTEGYRVPPHQGGGLHQLLECFNAGKWGELVLQRLLHKEKCLQEDTFVAITSGLAAPRRTIEPDSAIGMQTQHGLVIVQQTGARDML